jgi:outer membrane protein assembly factor BamE (lipoprotein component of BamABCDE complex)
MRHFIILVVATVLSGCATFPGGGDRDLTVGSVQSQIYIGMSGAEVAQALGSPNIVTTDEYRNETWIYDKISSRVSESETRGATGSVRYLDVWGPIAATSKTNTKSSSQRTLTVIIKFDEFGQVYDFAYHTSRF